MEKKLCKALNNAHDIYAACLAEEIEEPDSSLHFLELENSGRSFWNSEVKPRRAALAERVIRWGTKDVFRAGLELTII